MGGRRRAGGGRDQPCRMASWWHDWVSDLGRLPELRSSRPAPSVERRPVRPADRPRPDRSPCSGAPGQRPRAGSAEGEQPRPPSIARMGDEVVRRQYPPDPAILAPARSFAADRLQLLGLSDLRDDVELLLTEMITNA